MGSGMIPDITPPGAAPMTPGTPAPARPMAQPAAAPARAAAVQSPRGKGSKGKGLHSYPMSRKVGR